MCKIMKVLIDLLGAREHPDLHSLCRSCGGQPPWPNNTGESARRAALRHGDSRQLVRRIADRQARCARATSADPASTRSGPERPAPECSLHRDREPHGGGRMWRTRLRTEMASVASGHFLWGIGESKPPVLLASECLTLLYRIPRKVLVKQCGQWGRDDELLGLGPRAVPAVLHKG